MKTSTFALVFGIAYLLAGLMGFVPALLRPPAPDAPPTTFTLLYGQLLGLFPVNILHSAVHLAIGVWGLMAWKGAAHSKVFARSLAMLYGVLTLAGLIPGLNTMFGFIPLYGHDVWLHAATAAVAAYFGWRSEPEATMERRRMADRRQRMMPVARERRLGLADRRQMAYGT